MLGNSVVFGLQRSWTLDLWQRPGPVVLSASRVRAGVAVFPKHGSPGFELRWVFKNSMNQKPNGLTLEDTS